MDPIALLRSLDATGQGFEHRPVPAINTHIHLPPNFSAFQSIEQATEKAAEERLVVLGVGNYYDFRVYEQFTDQALAKGIFPLFGTEVIAMQEDLRRQGIRVNDPVNPGKTYICGKGITRFANPSNGARGLLEQIRNNDAWRAEQMAARLDQYFSSRGISTNLNASIIVQMVARRHNCPADSVVLQERHLAMAFQQRLFEIIPAGQRSKVLASQLGVDAQKADMLEDPIHLQEQIRNSLMKAGRPCFVPELYIDLDKARGLIRQLGGIECYPVVADMANPPCQFETPVDQLLQRLKAMGISMVEFISVRNSPTALTDYVRSLRQSGFAVCNGTEHNTERLVPLEPTCKASLPIPDQLRQIFWEGACVIAAHQYLTANGKPGFVDGEGRPNPAWRDPDQRIKALADIGSRVIRRYRAIYGNERRSTR